MAAMTDLERRSELGQQFRVDSVRMSAAAKSGHPTSAMSAADLMAVLLDGYLRYDYDTPKSPANDRLIFSKGHASTLVYAILRAAGAISDEELMSYRKFGNPLEGHPTPVLPWVDVATGSLGQGLPIGVGTALAQKRLDRVPARTWVLCGDSEMAEGSMWEAFEHAAHYELDNLTAILDVNRLGQRGETMVGWNTDVYVERARAFGWHAIAIDGHDLEQIDGAYAEAVATAGRPTVVVARTVKGKGVAAVENENGWHGKPLEDPEEAIEELGGERSIRIEVRKPDPVEAGSPTHTGTLELPRYEVGSEVATRKAYGEALGALGAARGDVVALDGEVSNSTYAEIFANAHPERYFEMYIAEQQMIAAAVGMQVLGWRPFASTFAAFLSRAYDFVRMAAVSRARICLSGSHAGVSIGEDGPSQMGLEDIAALRAIHGSVVLHPCDANQTAKLVAAMADVDGIAYMRTLRPATEVLYGPDEEFEIGGSRVLRSSDEDDVAIVAAGITVREALAAADRLAEEGVPVRVIDLYSIKPLDVETLSAAAEATQGRMVTVEDHWPAGGLGDAVLAALADTEEPPRVAKLAVRDLPSSGKPEELLGAAGIDAEHIAAAARRLIAVSAGVSR
jgi:transketolase